ncbi:hypothetical protein Droror1_Dr00024547 [Drosera rotundifolia]
MILGDGSGESGVGVAGSSLGSVGVCSSSTNFERLLKTIAIRSGDVYIPRGVAVPTLDKDILWEFQPKKLGDTKSFQPLPDDVFRYGKWSPASRDSYNLVDALTRHTTQVYPNSWTAILISLDNQGMWNIRSAMWARQYLGQQFYLRVWTPLYSLANEYYIPSNAL